MTARARKPAPCRELLESKYIRALLDSCGDALGAAGIEPSSQLLDAIAAYIELLLRWNRKLNLTTITDPQEILTRNFVESFLAARWLDPGGGRLCDVGSGAGFPGLALKLVRPSWQAVLLEPTSKKAAFLAEAARILKLQDVEILRSRWEDSDFLPESFDAITSRALGGYGKVLLWARERLHPGGRLILWLGARDADELGNTPGFWWERLAVPGSAERVILIGSRE